MAHEPLAVDLPNLCSDYTLEEIIGHVRERYRKPAAPLRGFFVYVYASTIGPGSQQRALDDCERMLSAGIVPLPFARCLLPDFIRKAA